MAKASNLNFLHFVKIHYISVILSYAFYYYLKVE